MLIFLATLLGTLSSMSHSRGALELENLALRHPVAVLQRSARKRPKLTPADRLLWGWLSRLWSDWRSALVIVKPETVVAWHRAGLRRFWTLEFNGYARGDLCKHLVAKHCGCNCAPLTLADIAYPSEASIVTGLATVQRSRLGNGEQGGK
jgi:hypothetical protein